MDELVRGHRQLWIFIDDIDRLEPKDAVQFIGLVRSMADLPWVRYFLAYDNKQLCHLIREAVFSNAHNSSQRQKLGTPEPDPEDYLEKFVQIELELPELLGNHTRKAAFPADNANTDDTGEPPSSSGALDQDKPSQDRNPNVPVPPVTKAQKHEAEIREAEICKLAKEEYPRKKTDGPVRKVAWLHTFVQAASSGFGNDWTPREYVRRYGNRCMQDQFDLDAFVNDVAAVTERLNRDNVLDSIIGPDALSLAKGIYTELVSRRSTPSEASRIAHDLLAAWAGRIRVAYKVGLDVIAKSKDLTVVRDLSKTYKEISRRPR